MNPKALLFDKFLKDEEITSFERKDFDDEDGKMCIRDSIQGDLVEITLVLTIRDK